MKNEKTIASQEEIEKAKNYLLEAKKNIQRLKNGRNVKRRFKFYVLEHKLLFSLILLIIVFSALIPVFIPKPPEPIINVQQDTVDSTINLIDANFTNPFGYPIQEKTEVNTSSELIILSSLAYSMLNQSAYTMEQYGIYEKVSQIEMITSNGTFRDYYNQTNLLPIFNQFLGSYAYIQSYYTNKGTDSSLSWQTMQTIFLHTMDSFYSEEREMIIDPLSNTSYLLDQTVFLWLISSIMLQTGDEILAGAFYIPDVIQAVLDSIYSNFYNQTLNLYYHEFDIVTNTSKNDPTAQDMTFLAISLSRIEKIEEYYFSYPGSSYNIHQRIINHYVDDDWLVHENNNTDNEVNIKNQVFFHLISDLMKLHNVASEIRNATLEFFLNEEGFVEQMGEDSVTCESCLYGLISIASEKWSEIENEREEYYSPPVQSDASFPFVIMMCIGIIVTIKILKLKKDSLLLRKKK